MSEWRIAPDGRRIVGSGGLIAELKRRSKKDACLIAAAPTMYEALRTLERKLRIQNKRADGEQKLTGPVAELIQQIIAPAIDLAGCKPWVYKKRRVKIKRAA